jgi:hypothetical protein
MPSAHLRTRVFLAAAATVAALAAASCFDDAVGPPFPFRGQFAVLPSFRSSSASVIPVSAVRITLRRPGQATPVVDTVVTIAADQDSVLLALAVPMLTSSETFTLNLALVGAAGDTVFRGGPISVTPASAGGEIPVIAVPIFYTGVGADAASVRITTLDPSVLSGDTVTLEAEALDDAGNPIPGTPVIWSSLDPQVAAVPDEATGAVVGQNQRGPARIVAALLTGPADTAAVLVQPLPAALTILSGDGQSGIVGTALAQPLAVRVIASDELGVRGVAVRFIADLGVVSDSIAITDSLGEASTYWTLGTLVGAQTARATVPLLSDTVTFGATGLAAGFTSLWTGAVSTAWATAGNWSDGTVPDAADTVYVPALAAFQPTLLGSTTIAGITLETGATLTLNAPDALTVAGDVLAGLTSIGGTGTVVMTDSGATVRGSLPNLRIEAPVTADAAVRVNGNLELPDLLGAWLTIVSDTVTVSGRATVGVGDTVAGAGVLEVNDSLIAYGLANVSPGTVRAGSGYEVFGTLGPVTLELFGSGYVLWVAGADTGIHPANLVLSGSAALPTFAGVPIPGDVTIAGNGFLDFGTGSLIVGGDFRTQDAGAIAMQIYYATLDVTGDIEFGGGSTAGLLTEGYIYASGGFTQTGDPESFSPSGALSSSIWTGSTPGSIISFANPGSGPGTSHFAGLSIEDAALGSDVYVLGDLNVYTEGTANLLGNGFRVFAGGAYVSSAVLDHALVTVDTAFGGTTLNFSDVTFQNYAGDEIQLTIRHPGSVAPLAFYSLSFLSTPTTGAYISAEDTDPGVDPLIIYLNYSSPLDGSAHEIETNASVDWSTIAFSTQPAGAPPGIGMSPFDVTAYNPDGTSNTVFGGAVTLTLENDPTGGVAQLVGTLTQTAATGTAGFSDVGVNAGGAGFSLRATVDAEPTVTAVSGPFNIGPLGVNAFWTGAVDSDWGTAGNWSPAAVPDFSTSVYVGPAPNQPIVATGAFFDVDSLFVAAGLTVDATALLSVNGNLDAGYAIGGTGTIVLNDDGTLRGVVPNLQVAFHTTAIDSVIVNGDLTLSGEVPELIVNGRLVRVTGSLYNAGDPGLNMTNPGDSVIVAGDVLYTRGSAGQLTEGVLLVRGDFFADNHEFGPTTPTFEPAGNHQVVFDGGLPQRLGMDLGGRVANHLHHLEIRGTSDVTIDSSLAVTGDLTILQNANASLLTGVQVTVDGDLVTEDQGTLTMGNDAAFLSVAGTASFGGGSSAGRLTAGSLSVYGDFLQDGTNSPASFAASGTHLTLFLDTLAQTISFGSPDTGGVGSHFAGLRVAQSGSATLTLNTVVPAVGNVEVNDFSTSGFPQVVNGPGELLVLGDVALYSDGYGIDVLPLAVRLGGALTIQGTFRPDTAEFFGAGQQMPYGVDYRNVVISDSVVVVGTGTEVQGNVIVRGDGLLHDGGVDWNIFGDLITQDNGAVRMDNSATALGVVGNVTFGGGSTAGRVTDGWLSLSGDFSQSGDPRSFAATDNHRTRFVSTAGVLQNVSFADPDTSQSHFASFELISGAVFQGVNLLSDVPVLGDFILPIDGGNLEQILGIGGRRRLTVGGLNVSNPLRLDSVLLTWTDSGAYTGNFVGFNSVTFAGYAPADTQFTILHTGGQAPFFMSGLTFETQPTTGVGYYIKAEDPGDPVNTLIVDLGLIIGGANVPDTSQAEFLTHLLQVLPATIFFAFS